MAGGKSMHSDPLHMPPGGYVPGLEAQLLGQMLESLLRIEHVLALEFVARYGSEHEAEYAKRHLLNEFRAQAREVLTNVDGRG